MRKVKSVVSLLLVVFVMSVLTSVSVQAGVLSNAIEVELGMTYLISHPKEAVEIVNASIIRTPTDEVMELLENSEEARTFQKTLNFPYTVSGVLKTGWITLNPQNTEAGQIVSVTFDSPVQYPKAENTRLDYNVFSIPYFQKNELEVDPLLAYKSSNNELVVWADLCDYSGQNIEVDGVYEVVLIADGEVFAKGSTPKMERPIQLSAHQEQLSTGVYNGLPNHAFMKMTFEPGTYDDTVVLSEIKDLESNYSLDYSYIK